MTAADRKTHTVSNTNAPDAPDAKFPGTGGSKSNGEVITTYFYLPVRGILYGKVSRKSHENFHLTRAAVC